MPIREERIDYYEAKRWFWLRTWLWFLLGSVVSTVVCFFFSGRLIEDSGARFWLSVSLGLGLELLGLLAAYVSLQFPWMRSGWRSSFLLNGPVCAAISAVCAFMCAGVVFAYLQSDAAHLPSAELIQLAQTVMVFGIVVGALWGFVLGSWFALRRDKYFLEPI